MIAAGQANAKDKMDTQNQAEPQKLAVYVQGIEEGKRIPDKYVYCVPDAKTHTKDGGNINPRISWSGQPEGTESFAIIMHDPDVPTVFDDANKEGKTISAKLPRRDFYHWVLVDIPAHITAIEEGQDSKDKTPKAPGKKAYGITGRNDYSTPQQPMGGYDGSCPPWNDEIIHHYHFTVYALDVPSLNLKDGFGGIEAMEAIKNHTIAKGSVIGTFTQNQELLKYTARVSDVQILCS